MFDRQWLRAGLGLALVAMGPMGSALADVQALERGIAALQAGKAQQAVTLLTQALNGPGISVRDRSRSMYFRAKAHLALQQSGLAMSDAGLAIWLKGLSAAEVADAEAVRAQAMASAGVVAGAVAVKPVMLNPVAEPPVVPVLVPKAAVLPQAAWPSADVVQAETPKLQAGAPVVAVAPVIAAPPWTASAVQREALSQVSVPQETVTPAVVKAAVAPIAVVGERPLETGSIGRFGAAVVVPEPVSVAQPVAAAPVIGPVAKVEAVVPQVTAAEVAPPVASGGLLPILGGLSVVGGMFAPPPSPHQAEIERANERQDRYAAKVREHNREIAKRNAGWAFGQTVAGEGR